MLVFLLLWLAFSAHSRANPLPWLPSPGMHEFSSDRPFPPERDPELVIEYPEELVLPTEGEPVIRSFVLPCVALQKPAFIEAFRLSVGEDSGPVKHAEIRFDSTSRSQELDARDRLPGFAGRPHYDSVRQPLELFGVWTPWAPFQTPPAGTAWRTHPQADAVVTCHLQPTGHEARIRPRLGLWLRSDDPGPKILTLRMANESFKLRPGTGDASVRDRFDLPVKARMTAVYPAGNRLARTYRLDVLGHRNRDANGDLLPVEAQRVLDIPEWQPLAQEMYRFKTPVELDEGTRLELQIRHEFPPNNAGNLRPVNWGARETDEWSEVYVQFMVTAEADALRLATAISQHQIALSIEGQESRDDNDLEAHLALALMYTDLGRFDTATAHAEKALSLAPANARAHAALGAVHVSQGFLYTAQEHLQQALALNADDAFAWYNLGNVYYSYQMIDKAREAFQKAEALNPRDYRVANNLGTIFLGDSKPDQARIRFERILQALPYQAPAFANLGRACQLLGQTQDAARFYQRAITLSPGMKDALTPLLAELKAKS